MSSRVLDQPGGPGKNSGHGHVYPRPDGVRARCGGSRMCSQCQADFARKTTAGAEQQLVRLDQIVGTCDWGGCNGETTAMRWDAETESWLPVCGEHETGGHG